MKKIVLNTIKILMILITVSVFGVMGIGYTSYQKIIQKSPISETVLSLQADKDYINRDEINETFLEAIVAVEDHRFYQHGAIDFIGILRAAANNLKAGEITQGGSTITQQVAKTYF